MIDPVAFTLGPLKIYWYGVFINIAFIIGMVLAFKLARLEDIEADDVLNLLLLLIPSALIGARLYYVIFNWSYYSLHPWQIFATWQGGLAIHGGIIGGAIAGLCYIYYKKLPLGKVADIFAPPLILGQAIGRWGNFMNQEAHGGPVSAEFMNYFPAFIRDQMYIQGQYYHPTFLYESLWNVGVFLFLIFYWNKRRFKGEIALLYLGLYSIGRFFIEAMRTDSLMLGTIRVAQLMSVTLIISSVILIIYFRFKAEKEK